MYPDFIATNADVGPSVSNNDQATAITMSTMGGGLQMPGGSPISAVQPSPSMNSSWFEFWNEPFNLPYLPTDNDLGGLQAMGDVVSVMQSHPGMDEAARSLDVQVRTEFVSKRLAGIPKSFVEQAQTQFIHRSLMEKDPDPALQDALSVAALYFLRNDSNRLLAIRTLEHKARYLIITTDVQAIGRAGLLAATQALLIYQLIRLFDGDIRLRAQAETDEPFLTLWTNQLRLSMSPVTPRTTTADGAHDNPSASQWQLWLVEESIRRTVIMALMLKGIYHFLKTGRDTEQDFQLSFSARASLWSAQSQQSWQAKRRHEGHALELRVVHWNEDIAEAKPEDLDDLGVQLMAMLWGVDATAEWLGSSQSIKHGFNVV